MQNVSGRSKYVWMLLPAFLTVALYALTMFFVALPFFQNRMMDDRRDKIQQLTTTVWQLVKDYQRRVTTGELTEEEAQYRAKERIRNLRYGTGAQDYFWINDDQMLMVMHPYLPALEGKDISGLTDSNGRRFVIEFTEMAKTKGEGFTQYDFQWNDDPSRISPKLSFVKYYEPWGWIIGTGLYLDDVAAEIGELRSRIALIFAAVLAAIIVISALIVAHTGRIERARAAAALELIESRNSLRSIFDAAPVGIGVIKNRIIQDINGCFTEVTGYAHEEILGKSTRILYPSQEEFDRVGEISARAVREAKVGVLETQFLRKDGRVADVMLCGAALDPNNPDGGITFTALDITEKKRAFDDLAASEEKLRTIFDHSPFIIYMKDREGRFLTINRLFERLFHVTEAEMRGKTDEYLFGAELSKAMNEHDRRVFESDAAVSVDEDVMQNGQPRTYLSVKFPIHGPGGEIACLCGISADITDRRRMEQALRDREENLRITLNSIGDAVIATDTAGAITRMNPVAETLTGWRFSEAAGRSLQEIFHIVNADTRQRIENPVEKVLRDGEVVGLANHTVLISADGTERQIADSGAPIRDSSGGIAGVVLVFRDVTEQYRMEEQLRHSQKMEAVGQLAGGVAHDFNNMLGGILGFAEILAVKLGDDKKLYGFARNIITAAERAADLTGKLLAFSRKGKSISTPVDLQMIVSEAVDLLKRGVDPKIVIAMEFKAEKPVVVGDPSQLQNAILNLGVNARDAMPEGGDLTLSTEIVTLDETYCRLSQFDITPGQYVSLEVKDSGCGMTPEIRERIFEPFFTTKKVGEGTGLGLSAVYGTVKDHHGAITVYSEPGVGSSFVIYLPLAEAANPLGGAPLEEAVLGSGQVLVVDDEQVIRAMAGEILRGLGYKVLLASDGEEAMEIFRRQYGEIDVVLLDMVMPKKNGAECFVEMRALDPDARIVISSGFARLESLQSLYDDGLCGHIKKPYRMVELSKVISAALVGRGRRHPEPPPA